MAKSKSGLPEGFNLGVSSEELIGKPVQVGGYLDEDPVLEHLKAQRQARVEPVAQTFFAQPTMPPQAPLTPEPPRVESEV